MTLLARLQAATGAEMTWLEYFTRRTEREADMPRLPLRKRPCSDCAVVWGLYREPSDGLKECPAEMQIERAARWFCHQTPMCACRGNADNLGREIIAALKAKGIE